MKKIVAGVLVVFVFLLGGCGAVSSSSNSVVEKYVPTEPGFIVPDYDLFKTPAEENGLEGTKIAFRGILKEQGQMNNAFYYTVSTDDGDWFVMVGETSLLTESQIINVVETGTEIEVYAEYLGHSNKSGLPSCVVVTDGYFIRVVGSDEKQSIAWDEIMLQTLVDSMASSSASTVSVPVSSSVDGLSASSSSVIAQNTVSQEQAIRKAKEYLAYTSFSASGLIGQLEYEGFSNEDAAFAVNSIDVDWNEQAAKKAQEYLDYSSFSRQSLISQLLYEGFSDEQAAYGVDAVGL